MTISQNQLQSLFKGFSIDDDKFDYHVIVCDNKYLAELGMAAFTTGQLYNWISKTDSASGLVNLKILGLEKKSTDLNSDLIKDVCAKILGFTKNDASGYFSTFRKAGRGGQYEKFETIQNWTYGEDMSYESLSFDDFNDALVEIPNLSETIFDLTYKSNPSGVDKFISNIIEMNNYVRYKSMTAQKSDWDFQSLARHYFIEDIKASKERCIQWSGVIPFTLNIGVETTEGSNSCTKEVPVNYKLFLFDEKNPIDNSRKISFNDLTIVSPKIDVFGRNGFKENGELNSISRNVNPNDNVAGKLSLTWNEFEGKFESGTQQIIGIISTDIEAAEVPTLEDFKNLSVENLLDPNVQLRVTVGSAIPILMQNGNPLQYSPDYKLDKYSRNIDDQEKLAIKIYNRLPVSFASGDTVVLNKIDGIWQPSLIGTTAPIKKKLTKLPQKWGDISYFMTNVNHFYVKRNGLRFTYQDYESAFRSGFYYGNSGLPLEDQQDDVLPDKWQDLDVENGNYKTNGINYGHLQITSFDFLSSKIGGMNTKNKIGNTHIDFDSSSMPYSREWGSDVRIAASSTAPFFGCVFPDGYNDNKITDYILNQHSGSKLAFETELTSPKKGILISSYSIEIPQASPLFDNSVNNNSYSEGIFAKDQNNNLKDSSLSHLPADIALNASPNGTYGSPLIVYNDQPFYPKERPDIHKLQHRIWHYDASGDFYSSFFDLEPVNPNRIQFRPLKAETYAFAEFNAGSDKGLNDALKYRDAVDNKTSPPQNPNKLYWGDNRGGFGMQSRETQKDFDSPLTNYMTILDRFWNVPKFGPYTENTFPIYGRPDALPRIGRIGSSGIRYNPDFVTRKPPTVNFGFNNNNNALNYHPYIWGSQSNAWALKPDCGAGGIGVIGARYTVSAEKSIVFDTENLLGQPPWILMIGGGLTNSVVALPIGAGGMFMGGVSIAPQDRRIYQTWGTCEFYYDLNTTGLFVRIFTAWPKDQTYFDPRYFSVLHFNPIDKKMKFAITKYWYKNGELRIDIPITDKPPNNEEEQYPNGWYKVDQQSTSVDVRVPTRIDGFDFTSNDTPITKGILREIKDWNIDNLRRGKLLPYKKRFPVIGIGKPNATFQSLFIDINQLNSVPNNAKLADYDCLIFNKGTGYTINDTFTVSNSDGAVLKPIIGAGGQITGFVVENSGKNLPSKLFANKDEKIVVDQVLNPNYKNLHKVVSLKLDSLSKGKDLEAYIPRGWLNKILIEDKKPIEILDAPLKLTSNPNDANKMDVTYDPSKISEVSVYSTSPDGTTTNFSENNQYDLFFHFHNDISHTLTDISRIKIAGKWAGTVPYENAVTLSINAE